MKGEECVEEIVIEGIGSCVIGEVEDVGVE